MASELEIGTTLVGLATLDSLGIILPKTSYTPHSSLLRLGDGTVKGMGWPTATWHWNIISATQKAILRTYSTGASEIIFIRTKLNDGTYEDFECVMIWPPNDEISATRSLSFTIQFQRLVVAV